MGKKRFVLPFFAAVALSAAAQSGTPNAQPGKCYAICNIPDQYDIYMDQITTHPRYDKTVVVPAEYEYQTKYVVVKPASKRVFITPAQFETITERIALDDAKGKYVVVKPSYMRFIEIPAEYETVTEQYILEPEQTLFEKLQPQYNRSPGQVPTKPASTKWVKKQTNTNCLKTNPDDCFIWCLVEIPAEYFKYTQQTNIGCDGSGVPDAGCLKTINAPAQYGTYSAQKEKTPAGYREEIVPAEYQRMNPPATAAAMGNYTVVTKQVLKTPASVREEIIPAEYKAVRVRVVKTPATTRIEQVPAQYTAVTKRRLIKAGGFTEWREVLCGEQVTGYTIRQIQQALAKAGYYKGPTDNKMNAQTKAALTKYQEVKGLPIGNLDFETLKSLGIYY